MENQENTKEELAKEVAKIAEEVKKEEPSDSNETAKEPEKKSEETVKPEESVKPEEAVKAVETTKPEETVKPDEDALESPKKKRGRKAGIIAGSIVGVLLVVLAFAYLLVAHYYADRLLMRTTVNGRDCAGMTIEEVETYMQSQVEDYILTIEEKNGVTEEIKGVDIGIRYNGVDIIKEAFAEQNAYKWPLALYSGNNIEAVVDFDYDEEKLDAAIANMACLKAENQVAPVSAVPVYENGTYTIREEEYGSQIVQETLYAVIHESVSGMEVKVNLEEKNCYAVPSYTKDSPEVISARDELNKCLTAHITYSLDNVTVEVDASRIQPWLSVDESMTVIVDESKVRAFTDTLGSNYNTPNASAEITTPTGKVATVSNARLGRVVGSAAECEQLIGEVKDGKTITREPILSQKATPEGATAWGTTYTEVDLSEQHMWYIADGSVAFECDVVTGSPGRDTPAGVFSILEKLRNKVLRGNIMPNGKREYETPVSYWARVTWSGVGFHDATWQSAFGGTRYKDGYGSHGCINMSMNDVATFYGMVSVGCPVVIHY